MVTKKLLLSASIALTISAAPVLAGMPEGTWTGDREGVTFTPSGENISFAESSKTVNPILTTHSQKMVPGVYQVAEKAYMAYGYALTSPTMVVGDDGVIIIDPPESIEAGKLCLEEFRKITDKPVKAVVYSHWHLDHFAGVRAFVDIADVESGEVKIIAHKTFLDNVNKSGAGGTGPIIGARLDYTSAVLLGDQSATAGVNMGLGPDFIIGETSLIAPNTLVDDRLEITVAGVEMEVVHAPSETTDEVVVWFPKLELLHSAEVLQGENFPNLYTIRGTSYRNPQVWYRGMEILLQFPAKYMLPSHGRPVSGYDNVKDVLTSYRDAIQFVYDQTIRYMNEGMLPDELVEVVKLPEHLADHPWLGETYGTVAHSVRSIYSGEIGWFEGDPTYLSPLKKTEASARYIKLIGGKDKVMQAAQKAFSAGDFQWSAELSSHLVRTDVDNKAARKLKSDALRQLGYAHFNPNWRNFYLTAAAELDGSIDYSKHADMSADDMIRSFPTEEIINGFRFRINPERTVDVNMTMGFRFPDEDKAFALEIRRGIVQFHDSIPGGADAVLEMDRAVLDSIITGGSDVGHDAVVQDDIPTDPMAKLFESGKAKMVKGDLAELKRFLGYFDKLNKDPVPIATK